MICARSASVRKITVITYLVVGGRKTENVLNGTSVNTQTWNHTCGVSRPFGVARRRRVSPRCRNSVCRTVVSRTPPPGSEKKKKTKTNPYRNGTRLTYTPNIRTRVTAVVRLHEQMCVRKKWTCCWPPRADDRYYNNTVRRTKTWRGATFARNVRRPSRDSPPSVRTPSWPPNGRRRARPLRPAPERGGSDLADANDRPAPPAAAGPRQYAIDSGPARFTVPVARRRVCRYVNESFGCVCVCRAVRAK